MFFTEEQTVFICRPEALASHKFCQRVLNDFTKMELKLFCLGSEIPISLCQDLASQMWQVSLSVTT